MRRTALFFIVFSAIASLAMLSSRAAAQTDRSTRVTDLKQHAPVAGGGNSYAFRGKADYVLKELDLRPGDTVVDIGAGEGWWSERMAQAVGETGTIHAAEVEQKLVDKLKQKFAKLPQVKPYLCKTDNLELPEGSCDLAFLSYTYHHLPKDARVEYLKRLRNVVKPTGRFVVVEKYPQIARQGKDHGSQLSLVVQQCEEAGWILVRCELLTGMETYMALFVQKELFEPGGAQTTGTMSAGVAMADITPPLGYRMAGYFSERGSTATHDPLLAKAVVFRQGDRQAALVFCDLIGVPWELTAEVRRQAQQKTGIPAANILLAATHAHTGPLFAGTLRKHLHEQAVAKAGTDPREKEDYAVTLAGKLVRAIAEAQAATKPVKLQAGVGRQEGLSFNRRFFMKDGTVRFNPGKLNPETVRPAGPIDPDVGLLLLRNAADSRPLASLTVFALHLDTVGGTEYSADYPCYLQQTLRAKLGEPFVSLFGNGTCGDINHIDVSHNRPQKGHEEAKRIGDRLGATVAAELEKVKDMKRPSLAVGSEIVNAPLQEATAEDIAWADEAMKKVGTPALPFLDQVKAYKIKSLQSLASQNRKTLPMPVQVFRLGDDTAVVGLPGEVFADLGLAIKRASPFATTLVIELCNDSPGYVPTRKAFAEGSYETINSRVQPGGGEMLVDAAVRLLKELKGTD
jgi:SAM-dependent methyltransferase